MRILVIGAAGRIGRHVVEQALGHGHDVVGFVHSADLSVTHPRLTVVRGDVRNADDVISAIDGCDAVAFAVGSAAGAKVHSEGIANVLYGMALHGATRLVAVSAGGVFARTDRRLSLAFRALIATTLRAVYDDLERMEQLIAASGVEWTIVRPSGLSDEPASGHYRLARDGALLSKASRIARADVAGVVLKALETDAFVFQTLAVAG